MTNRPCTLLMTADTIGGVWTYAMTLAAALAPRGVRVVLATMGALPTEAQHAEACRHPNIKLCPSAYKLEWMHEPWRDVDAAGAWLLELERTYKPDIIHLNGYAHAALPFRVPKLVVAHSCVATWWQAVKREPLPAEWNTYKAVVTRGLLAADFVAAPTAAFLGDIESIHGTLPRTAVIPNGVFKSAARREKSREPFVFSAGRMWDEAKNCAQLVRVAPEIPWPILLAGDTTAPCGAQTSCGALKSLGKLTPAETASWMARAAVYASPARYEPFGLSVLEAANAGCALVLGDIPTLREVWGDAAIFAPPDDTMAWRVALRTFIQDSYLCAEYAARAADRAHLYSAQNMAEGYQRIYQALLGTESV